MSGDPDGRLHGTVKTIDAFGDGRALTLHLEAETFLCGGRRIVLFSTEPISISARV